MKVFLFVMLMVPALMANAQQNPLPLNIQRAYNNKTRSADGTPGKAYWQNHADYTLEAIVDTAAEVIRGKATIVYYNESPDTLKSLVLRLYGDFFRKGNARQWPVSEGDISDGVRMSRLKIGGEEYDPKEDFPRWWITNFEVRLKKKIAPGSQTPVELDWEFTIPTERGLRMRKYNDGHYFIAYWYPQIAVYDDVDGWDPVEYLGNVEFYNDFNHFDVSLTVPAGFLVRATGDIQNLSENLQPEIAGRYEKALQSDEVVRIVTQEDYRAGRVYQPGKLHTWRFLASAVPDFSFAMSARANWDGVSPVIDRNTGKRTFTDVLYPDGSPNWDQAADISGKVVVYLSEELPGIPFPYSHMTSFCSGGGGGGMETPMMANNGAPRNFASFAGLLFHEIAHTYFPFYMGTNERKYAWMDEGWASYLPASFIETLIPGSGYLENECREWEEFAGQEADIPLMVPSYQHNHFSSARMSAYNHPALAYHTLRRMLGDDLFKKALHEFMNRWKGKHPLPYDFFNTFSEVAGEDLGWFWSPWFFEQGYPDLAIRSVEENKVTIERKGIIPVEVEINYKTSDGQLGQLVKPASVWKADSKIVVIKLPSGIRIEEITLGNGTIPDVDDSNNSWIKN